jgi:hypothetical protein
MKGAIGARAGGKCGLRGQGGRDGRLVTWQARKGTLRRQPPQTAGRL